MKITKTQQGNALKISLEGRLDTVSAPELQKELKAALDGIDSLELDFEKLDYVSSAGLRVLVSAHKSLLGKGSMKITHANVVVREVFDVTGLMDILSVE